jgi:hypothetical protein
VEDSPPDIPDKPIPVLRKKPVVIKEERPARGPKKTAPRAPVLRTSPIAAALRKRAAESDGKPRRVDAEVHLPTEEPPVAKIEALRAKKADVPPAPEPRSPLLAPEPRRARGLGLVGFYGTFLVLLAVAGIVVNASLPWLTSHPDENVGEPVAPNLGSGVLDRSGLANERAVNPYFDRLVGWPMVSYTFLILVGLLIAGIDELQNVTIASHRMMQVILLGASAFLGFIVLLTGTRWFGLYVNAILDEGPTPIHLHMAPYLNLVIGAVVFGASTRLLLRRWRVMRLEHSRGYFAIEDIDVAKNLILGAAAILLLLPLLPFASIGTDEGTAYLGEAEFAAARNTDDDGLDAIIASYGSARAMVWLTLYGALFSLFFAMLHRSSGRHALLGAHVAALGILALPLAVGTISTLVFYGQVIAGATRPSINWLPLLGFGGLGFLFSQYVRTILLPFVAHARRNMVD